MRRKLIKTISCLLAIGFTSMLGACGSGESDSSATPTPQPTASSADGLWNGTTAAGRTIAGPILDDGSYWLFYTASGNPNVLAGLIQGTGTSQLGSFTSSNARDFNLEGAGTLEATINGTFVQKTSLNGTIAYVNGSTGSFTSTYDADYELAPTISLVAGNYSGLRADNQTVSVTLDAAGNLSGSSSDGCTFVGSFSPRGKGNVFNVIATFQGGPCNNGTNTISGLAFYKATTQRLYSAGLNSNRTNGFMFIGTRR